MSQSWQKLNRWLTTPYPIVKIAPLFMMFMLCLVIGACQVKENPGETDSRQIVTVTPSPLSPAATSPSPATPALFARPTTPANRHESAEIKAIAPTETIPATTGPVEPPTTSTPPQIADGLPTPPTALPTAVATIDVPAGVTNIVLAGNDVRWPQGGRTDALLIVSINRENKTATILSLPRDLYVYIPGWTMNRINLALPHGHGVDYPGGGGRLLADTIEYNFGLSIDHYARIGFDGFSQVIDALGGVEVALNCPLTDWRLKSPELDPAVEENWERYSLEPGIQQMDGDLALWYARSRRSTNDFDRGRRLQQLTRAMLAKGLSLSLVDDVPELWGVYHESIETDLSLPEILALAALAPAVYENGVQHLTLPSGAYKAWRVPVTGEAVQLPRGDVARSAFEQLALSPALKQGERPALTVEVVTGDRVLFQQAAENLNWFGVQAVHRQSEEASPAKTLISYHHSTLKGSFHWLVAWLFGVPPEDVDLKPSDSEPYDYQVVLGRDFNPCLPILLPPADLYPD